MSSRSIHRWLVVIATLVLWVGSAHAGRKRVVVLDLTGPKAEKFHKDLVKLVKKSHTVISTEKWNGTAEELDAGKITEKNVKKVARKLKVDAVIYGKVDKRRDEYIIKLKLRSGVTGEILGGSMQTKADGPRLDGQAQRDISDELISQIGDLESNSGGGGDDDDEDKPRKMKDDDEDKPRKSGFSRKDKDDEEDNRKKKKDEEERRKKDEEERRKKDDEDKRRKKDEEERRKKKMDEEAEAMVSKKDTDDDDDDDDRRSRKRKKSDDDDDDDRRSRRRKRKASADDDDEDSIEDEADDEEEPSDRAVNLSPAHRAIDAVVGLSFTARNLKFTYAADLGKVPPGYRQSVPVAGALVDVTLYPLSIGHKNKTIYSGIGLNVLYDQVLVINSRKRYLDGQGESQTADLKTTASRWQVGGVFRYPLGTGVKAPVVGGTLSYGKQLFTVDQTLPNMELTDIPNVTYKMLTPTAFVRFPVTDKIVANVDAGLNAMMDTGEIQTSAQYGAATVFAYELEVGVDYMVTKNIFARAGIRYQAISFKFKGDPTSMTNTRDTDPEQDVTGAKDTYFGGAATIGYVY